MDFIKVLREDNGLSDLLCDVCDIEIFPEFKTPQDEGGHLAYNISGKTFARAGSGSEYILLEDGSIGFWGSEGDCGRIADNLQEFFEFMVNCPYWQDYLDENEYRDQEELREFAREVYEEHIENEADLCGFDLPKAQQELAGRMGIVHLNARFQPKHRLQICRNPFISSYPLCQNAILSKLHKV